MNGSNAHSQGSTENGQPAVKSNCVLIVEDSKAIQVLLSMNINKISDIEVVSAYTLEEAKALLEEQADRFFVSILDLNLPDAPDGEVVDLVQTYGVPVIVMTGTINESIREQMLDKNVLDYIVKTQASEVENVTHIIKQIYENHETKVLVVDDSISYVVYIKGLLKNYKYQTFTAKDGVEALEILAENPDIALIITDYNMPRMDGKALIQAVRKNHRREDLAIIGLSDTASPGLSAILLKSGANDYLSKPFEVEEFYCRVTQNANMIQYIRQIEETHAKDRFLINMSHEIRTPMHAVLSYSKIGEKKVKKVPAEQISTYFSNIHSSGQRLLHLLNNILDLSKLEAGDMKYFLQQHDILSTLGAAVEAVSDQIGKKFIELEVVPAEVSTHANFDSTRIQQVFTNLLSNAIAYTPDGGHITVRFKEINSAEKDSALEVSVSDDGVGIPLGELETIFEKFVQSSKTRTGAGGTGIGLAICKEIIEEHGGTIQVENNSGAGSTFSFTLPRGV
jgi:signal transduction histidine kinase